MNKTRGFSSEELQFASSMLQRDKKSLVNFSPYYLMFKNNSIYPASSYYRTVGQINTYCMLSHYGKRERGKSCKLIRHLSALLIINVRQHCSQLIRTFRLAPKDVCRHRILTDHSPWRGACVHSNCPRTEGLKIVKVD